MDYGFNFSASRSTARTGGNTDEQAAIAASVLSAKLCLMCVVILLAPVIPNIVPALKDGRVLACAVTCGLANGLNVMWYFIGIESLPRVIFVDVLAKAASALAVIAVVKSSADVWLVLAINTGAALISTGYGTAYLYSAVRFRPASFEHGLSALRNGWEVFLSRSMLTYYTSGNALILGAVSDLKQTAYFSGAERITRATVFGFSPFTQVFYPKISHLLAHHPAKADRIGRALISTFVLIGAGLSVMVAVGSQTLVRMLLGARFNPAVPCLRLLSFSIPLSLVVVAVGTNWLLPLGMESEIKNAFIVGAVVNVILGALGGRYGGSLGMASATLIVQLTVTALLIRSLVRSGRNPFAPVPARSISIL